MNETPGRRQLTLRLVPWPLLLIATGSLLIAAFIWHESELRGGAWLIVAVPVFLGLLLELTTVTVDQDLRRVTIRRARPWGATERVFSFDDVLTVAVESSTSGRSRTYSVVFALRSGERVPLRSVTSSGAASKRRLALRLVEAVNQGLSMPIQAALDGVVRESSAGSQDGVEWKLDRVTRGEGWELTLFWTGSARLADGFVLIAPAAANGGPPPLSGILGAIMRVVLQQYLRALELTEADVPHLDRAVTLDDEALSQAGLVASTSAPDAGRRWIEGGAAALVAQWQQQPLSRAGRAVPPYVLLGPSGLRLLFRVNLRDEPEIARVRELGLALARLTPD
jgi:hypothetical protein